MAKAQYHFVTVTVTEKGQPEQKMRLRMPGPKPTAAEQRRAAEQWCRCTEPVPVAWDDRGTAAYQGGLGHGWDCARCGKLLQVG